MRHFSFLLVWLAVLSGGCATHVPIPDGTRTVWEVAYVPTRQEIVTGDIQLTRDNQGREPIKWPWLHAGLLKQGMKDEEIVDASVVIGRTQYYWHNVIAGIVRQYLRPSTVPKGLELNVGNVIEVEIAGGGYPRAVRVLYKSLADGKCEYRRKDRGAVSNALNAINPIGGPGAASLYCPAIEAQGWFAENHNMGVEWFDRRLTAP
jgi:hypothetical protein